MGKKLVIVESPAKCSKIAGFLGADFVVVATYGHIRALEEDLEAVGLDRGFEPNYRFLTKEKARAINAIKLAAQGCDTVYLAADDDREGEAIAYSACLLLKLNPATAKRAVFHEITATAVCGAVAAPRVLDMNKVWAQQSRAVLDMMVGFTISPLLWKHVGSGLSAGRCQTPALRLVWEREEEVKNFSSEASMGIRGTWSSTSSSSSSPFDATLTDDLEDEESALNYLENHSAVASSGAVVTSAETRPWTERAPAALITSTLQQQVSALFRINPKATMSAAQRLYEQGHITYMRTDSATMSEEAVVAAKEQVEKLYGAEYISVGSSGAGGGGAGCVDAADEAAPKKKPGRPKKAEVIASSDKPKAQEAHEAIRPTHFETRELPSHEDWSGADRKIYGLIWLRAIQSIMAPAKGEKRTVKFVADGDDTDFEWLSTWKNTDFEGWKKADTRDTAQKETEDDESQSPLSTTNTWAAAQKITAGTKLKWSTLEAFPKTTKASPRYTEATLVRELEKRGIGRPSTFAMLISTIQEKNYVEKKNIEGQEVVQKRYTLTAPGVWPPSSEEKKIRLGAEKDKLVPTGLGVTVIDFALKHFPDLFDYPFTAGMETRLDKIATGEEAWKRVLEDTWNSYKERYTTLKGAKGGVEDERRRDLGDGLTAIKTRKGPLLMREDPSGNKDATQFYGWPSGLGFEQMTLAKAQAHITSLSSQLGEHDGEPILLKAGPYGKYIEHKTVKIPYKDVGEKLDDIIKRLEEKGVAADGARIVGGFEIRVGPYGPYMFKRDVAKKQFVSVPAGVNLDTLTVAAATALFQAGIAAKARAKNFGGAGGGGGGAGGGAGGGTASSGPDDSKKKGFKGKYTKFKKDT
jgi:DNA topoisomerase-1